MQESAYTTRRQSLATLGFGCYDDYLNSIMWRRIRADAMAKHKHKCACCGDRAWQVHHASYALDVMEGRNMKMLVPLCDACHEAIEFDGDRKLSFEEVAVRLLRFSEPDKYAPQRPDRRGGDHGSGRNKLITNLRYHPKNKSYPKRRRPS